MTWYGFYTHFQCYVLSGFPHTTRQFLDTSWVSRKSTQFWHSLPGDSSIFHRLRSQYHKTPSISDANSKPRLLSLLLTNGYKPELPRTPSLGLIRLLDWLTELRKPIYWVDYYIWHSLWAHLSPQISMCSPNCKFSGPLLLPFYGGFRTRACMIKSLAISDWFYLQPLLLFCGWGGRIKGSNLQITG